MTKSNNIPSFLYTDDFNFDNLIKLRADINNSNKSDKSQVKLTFMPFVIKAVSLSLKEFPEINSFSSDKRDDQNIITEFTIKKDHNISIAMDTPNGLLVPNIKAVQTKSVFRIQKDLTELRDKALSLKLSSSDLSDGTFSISNIGPVGGKVLAPCILPPQVAIMAMGKIWDSIRIITKEDKENHNHESLQRFKSGPYHGVLFHKAMTMSISADHRIIDGASVAKFAELLRLYIEQPLKIITADS